MFVSARGSWRGRFWSLCGPRGPEKKGKILELAVVLKGFLGFLNWLEAQGRFLSTSECDYCKDERKNLRSLFCSNDSRKTTENGMINARDTDG